jgi:hypothetical protein
MDALSDVLRAIRLSGAVYLNGEFSAPWCMQGSGDEALCSAFLPGSRRVVSYHLICEGSCWAQLASGKGPVLALSAGEILVVPQGETHLLGSTRDMLETAPTTLTAEQVDEASGQILKLSSDGAGEKTRMVCGFLACDEVLSNPLLAALPRLFKVNLRSGRASAWLESSVLFAVEEAAAARAGSTTVLAKLSELCSSKPCAGASTRCPKTRRAGSRACAIVSSAARCRYCTPSPRMRGRSKNSRARWVCRAPPCAAFRRICRPSSDAIPGALAAADRRATTAAR